MTSEHEPRASLPPSERVDAKMTNIALDCGWGRLLFGQTFASSTAIVATMREEAESCRDIAMYVADPHVVLSLAPQELFLDPSHTFRLDLDTPLSSARSIGFAVRELAGEEDARAVQAIYAKRRMVQVPPQLIADKTAHPSIAYLVAQNDQGSIVGTVMGIDHVDAFGDRDGGSSLWALAVDPQTMRPGVGEALVVKLAQHFRGLGRRYMDLSVMHDNHQAISLYEKLGFYRVPIFSLKRRNSFNEPLYIAQPEDERLNPYAAILVREARRRGIGVEVLDEQAAFFSLTFGGRSIVCRESLSELTTAVALSRCDDKRVTRRILVSAGIRMPEQLEAGDPARTEAFLREHGKIVIKPARGEQGFGVSVGIRTLDDVGPAVQRAGLGGSPVLLEQCVDGEDLRIVVINFRVVAAAVRRPPRVVGNGDLSVRALIEKQSRRRAAATGGESRIPIDAETERCVREAGFTLESVLAVGEELMVRKAANLHTGGTIHDVTAQLHPTLVSASERAAEVLDIPVVGFDLMVSSPSSDTYWLIEANERPGLANHEPQPTAQRFIDLLFPQTARPTE
jgi:GNAT-family acetyltransferase (TIGR03103 family)